MASVEEELKARLLAEMEGEVERLLAEVGDHSQVTLTDIERLVGEAGRRIQQRVVERLVAEAAQAQGPERVSCPGCGGKLRYKGQKARWIATSNGEIQVERGYFYCDECGKGIFPPGSEVGAE
jgi:hypothetical protein